MNSSKSSLVTGYALSLLLLLISAVASYMSISNLISSTGWVNHTQEVIKKLDGTLILIQEAEASQRGYLLTGDERYLDTYRAAEGKVQAELTDLKTLTIDNQQQQADFPQLQELADRRLALLREVLSLRRRTGLIAADSLDRGTSVMNRLTNHIRVMEAREEKLLKTRTEGLHKFAGSTPTLILVASLLAILVTIFSFYRVSADFRKRSLLQKDLEEKNSQINERITVIERIAGKIAAGNFKERTGEGDKEKLGVLAASLDQMAASLETAFDTSSANEWQQTGLASLNELMIGEKNIKALSYHALEFLHRYTASQTAVFYLAQDTNLFFSASIALEKEAVKQEMEFGEGIAGQAALARSPVILKDIEETSLFMNIAGGKIRPVSVIAVPVLYEDQIKGVMELGSAKIFSQPVADFLSIAAYNIGIALNSARDHERLQDLLQETQAQSEELQSQHSELELMNAELAAQAEKLQASEEELRVQQEELQEANSALEEKSRSLEEKNELILERNLDIQHKAEQLEIGTKYKSEFLANMSHELRTPLNSILLLSRLLSENHQQNLNADQVEYAGVIQNSGKSLLTLIDEILDLSKIEAGKMDLVLDDVKIDRVISDVRSMFGPMAKEKDIELIIEKSNGLLPAFETDGQRLDQILRNLLSNALKFTKKGSVTLAIRSKEGMIQFAVKDTGIGIPPDKQQTIFEAFQQADGSTKREFGGTGLGLSISRELAKLLGGNIQLISKPGTGSEFILSLPLDKQEEQQREPERANPFSPQTELPRAVQTEMNSGREIYVSPVIPPDVPDDRESITGNDRCLLIIEDDTAFAKSLLDYVRNQGYKGIVAVRGDEATALAIRFLPQGILLDVQLPVKSGWEVMDELKSDEATRAIPVHMMSSHEVRLKSLSQGAVDFINKPVAFEKLGEMIRKIESALSGQPKKVLIVEENSKHAQALAYFLKTYQVAAEIKDSVEDGIAAISQEDVNCVILDMGIPAAHSYDILDKIKKTPGLENLPIIVFTGKNLSRPEEARIRQYADSIVIKTAHSYQRILDEVSLFLHLVEENEKGPKTYKKSAALGEVLRGKTILVADDDVRNIFSLTKSLEAYGVEIISATDGKEALNRLAENPKTDLVLMDMMMPEMDGYQTMRNIRDNIRYSNLPIIAVTAKAMTGDREKCISAGASDYITKPVDLDQLISLLRVWLYRN